jgi:integrase
MPNLTTRRQSTTPTYRHHRASGQAVVTLSGIDHYLGRYGTTASRREYDRVVGEWLAAGRHPPANVVRADGLTVVELIARYWSWCQSYYLFQGRPTGEPARIRDVLKPLRRLYGKFPVSDFGPIALKTIRKGWIDAGLARRHINQRVGRIKRLFKWGVAEELVPPSTFQALQAVDGLRYGRTEARETEPIKPVLEAWVEAILPYVAPTVRAMIQLQQLTGMRGGEVCVMRPVDIDVGGPIWVYEPHTHKNRWRGHRRLIPLGPRAQEIIKQFLKPNIEAYLFSPRQAVAEHNATKRKRRVTRVQPSQVCRKKRQPRRQPGDRYDSRSYYRAIANGFMALANARARAQGIEHRPKETKRRDWLARFGVCHWHPHQLRHTHATAVRKRYGLEAAQVALGHKQANITEIYAETNLDLAFKIAKEVG